MWRTPFTRGTIGGCSYRWDLWWKSLWASSRCCWVSPIQLVHSFVERSWKLQWLVRRDRDQICNSPNYLGIGVHGMSTFQYSKTYILPFACKVFHQKAVNWFLASLNVLLQRIIIEKQCTPAVCSLLYSDTSFFPHSVSFLVVTGTASTGRWCHPCLRRIPRNNGLGKGSWIMDWVRG